MPLAEKSQESPKDYSRPHKALVDAERETNLGWRGTSGRRYSFLWIRVRPRDLGLPWVYRLDLHLVRACALLSVEPNYRAKVVISPESEGDKGSGSRHLLPKLFVLPLQIADFTLEACEDRIIWIGWFIG